jgi:hypothetical protein
MNIKVSLMGGLGNQLFQLSFALSLAKEDSVNLIPILGNSRRNSRGEVEIASFILPDGIRIQEDSVLNSRIISAGLSRGLRAASTKRNGFLIGAIEKAIPILSGRILQKISFARGVGSTVREVHDQSILYIGYFQSHKFTSDFEVFAKLMNLSPKLSNPALDLSIREVTGSRPILLHVRLTDYLMEGSFGLPDKFYYREAIELASKTCGDVEIWIFSDDPKNALNFLPAEFAHRYRLAPVFEETVHNFELMRYFAGFIIANSSFSWWAAHLRKNRDAPVIHPWPWFRQGLHDRKDLVPEAWVSLPSGLA